MLRQIAECGRLGFWLAENRKAGKALTSGGGDTAESWGGRRLFELGRLGRRSKSRPPTVPAQAKAACPPRQKPPKPHHHKPLTPPKKNKQKRHSRLVIIPLCAYPVEELAARAEVEAEVEVVRGRSAGGDEGGDEGGVIGLPSRALAAPRLASSIGADFANNGDANGKGKAKQRCKGSKQERETHLEIIMQRNNIQIPAR
ncbi:hypothetical protein B0H16DRAFT_1466228 [Mycena metata]|uniref:Uncharacterized protein n=1 Tax=Mycena metata TaxID=1033252 RepID=A0AAD7I8B1_9AGAR|nr:hypothetical protein B0H16DRAFT_1466228 [Mycena metata]